MSDNTTLELSPEIGLRYFHEMTEAEKSAEWATTREYINLEANFFEGAMIYPHLEAVDAGVAYGSLAYVSPKAGQYGIVSPIRDRERLPSTDSEGSVPYLDVEAAAVLDDMTSDIKKSSHDTELMEVLERNGLTDFRASLTSLTRTSFYHKIIVAQGRLAVGLDGSDEHSVHEMARAYDIDHGALYVTDDEGVELALNRNSSADKLEVLNSILPIYRTLLRRVIELYQDSGVVMALEEVPAGWGAWHVAVLPQTV